MLASRLFLSVSEASLPQSMLSGKNYFGCFGWNCSDQEALRAFSVRTPPDARQAPDSKNIAAPPNSLAAGEAAYRTPESPADSVAAAVASASGAAASPAASVVES